MWAEYSYKRDIKDPSDLTGLHKSGHNLANTAGYGAVEI